MSAAFAAEEGQLPSDDDGGLAAALADGTTTRAFWESTVSLGKGLCREASQNLYAAADALTDAKLNSEVLVRGFADLQENK